MVKPPEILRTLLSFVNAEMCFWVILGFPPSVHLVCVRSCEIGLSGRRRNANKYEDVTIFCTLCLYAATEGKNSHVDELSVAHLEGNTF